MKRRDLLAISGAVLGGGAVLGTGAISQSEVTREGNITVSADSNAYLGVSQGPTNALLNLFDGDGQKDTVVEITNQIGVDVGAFQVDNIIGDGVEITGRTSANSPLTSGSTQRINAELTAKVASPTLTYDVRAGDSGDDVSIDATREQSLTVPTGLASRDGQSSDSDRHVFRIFPTGLNGASLEDVVVTYPEDFDISPSNNASVRVGATTDEDISIGSGDLTSTSGNGNSNEITITPNSNSSLNEFNTDRVLQVSYGNIDNGNFDSSNSGFSVDVSINSDQSNPDTPFKNIQTPS